jgi:hypothetical protein
VGSRMGLTWVYEIKAYKEVWTNMKFSPNQKQDPVTYVLRSMIWTCCQIFNILPKLFLVSELHVSMKFILPQH